MAPITALEPYDLPWRVFAEAFSAMVNENLRLAADSMLEALACAEREAGVIVIEDAHRLVDGRIFEWLDKLIERLPSNWSLAITSRVDPPLALARLRVQGGLEEFRADDLRFSREDAASLALALARQGRLREAWEAVAPAIAAVHASAERLHLLGSGKACWRSGSPCPGAMWRPKPIWRC